MDCFSCHIPMAVHQADASDGFFFECDRCGHVKYPFRVLLSDLGHRNIGRGTYSTMHEAMVWVSEEVSRPGSLVRRALIINEVTDERTVILVNCR